MDDRDVNTLLREYIVRDEQNNRQKYVQSLRILQAVAPDHDVLPPARIEFPHVRSLPQLEFHNCDVLELFVFKLPNIISDRIIRQAFFSIGVRLTNVRIKRKSNGQPLVWISVKSLEDSLRVQSMCRDGKVMVAGHKLRVAPSRPRPISSVFRCNSSPDALITRLPPEVLRIIIDNLTIFDDHVSLVTACPYLYNCYPISLEISVDSRPHFRSPLAPINPADLMRFTSSKSNRVYRKIVLSDRDRCAQIAISDVADLIRNIAPDSLTQLNLSAVTISSGTIEQLSQYSANLETLVIGECSGPCDQQLSTLLTQATSLKSFGCHNNSWFSCRVFTLCPNLQLQSISIVNCHRLHLDYLMLYMRKNIFLKKLHLENCRQVMPSCTFADLMECLSDTHLTTFNFIYKHDELPYDFHDWSPTFDSTFLDLTHVTMQGINPMNSLFDISSFLSNGPNLSYIDLSECNLYRKNIPFEHMIYLETLKLNSVHCLDDGFWAKELLKLKTLEVCRLKSFDESKLTIKWNLVKWFIKNCPSLQRLSLLNNRFTNPNELKNIFLLEMTEDRTEQLTIAINRKDLYLLKNSYIYKTKHRINPLVIFEEH